MRLPLPRLRFPKAGLFVLAAVLAGGALLAAQAPKPLGDTPKETEGFTVKEGFDQVGHTYSDQQAPTTEACLQLCKDDSRCVAFTFEVKREMCHLKDAQNLMRPSPGKVTGARKKES